MLNFLVFGKDAFDLQIFRVDHLFKLAIFVIKSFDLIKMLLFEVLYFAVEIVIKLRLEAFNLFSMLAFFITEIAFESLLFLS